MSDKSKDSHILLMLSSFLILVIHMPPFGDSYKIIMFKRIQKNYLPHGHLAITEKEQVDFSRHL